MTDCLAVSLPYFRAGAVHHIVGRCRRHGTARHIAIKRSLVELNGCHKPSRHIVSVVRQTALKSVPGVAALVSLVAGSGVIGGFGRTGVFDTIPGCIVASCRPAVSLQEPFSAGLLGIAALSVVFVRGLRRLRSSVRV